MFDFQKNDSKQHASNVFDSFIRSVNEQFNIKSFRYGAISSTYSFSNVPNPLRGWTVSIDKNNRVIVKTYKNTLTSLGQIIRITPKKSASLCPVKKGDTTPDERALFNTILQKLIVKTFGVEKHEFSVSTVDDYISYFSVSIDITEMTPEKLQLLSAMFSISDFMPRATSLSNYAL